MRRHLAFLIIFAGLGGAASAQDLYLAQVMVFAGNVCPNNSVPANGSLLQIQQNTALFHLLGTTYGGDGQTTFGLPNITNVTSDGKPLATCIAVNGIYPH